MTPRQILSFVWRTIVLSVIFAVSFIVAAALSGVESASRAAQTSSPAPQAAALWGIVAYSFVVALVIAVLIVRSQQSKWKLIAAIFLAVLGTTVVSQLETAIYLRQILPAGMVPKLFAMGFLQAALFAPLSVLVMGRFRSERRAEPAAKSVASSEWIWKLAAIAAIYVVIYYTFGYWIAWQSPAVRAYYGGTDSGSFFTQMGRIWNDTPWMFAFQILRAWLWVLLTLPMVRSQNSGRWATTLLTAAFFAVWSFGLLLPNPLMPEAVRMAHFAETLSSNFLFGGIIGWLFAK